MRHIDDDRTAFVGVPDRKYDISGLAPREHQRVGRHIKVGNSGDELVAMTDVWTIEIGQILVAYPVGGYLRCRAVVRTVDESENGSWTGRGQGWNSER